MSGRVSERMAPKRPLPVRAVPAAVYRAAGSVPQQARIRPRVKRLTLAAPMATRGPVLSSIEMNQPGSGSADDDRAARKSRRKHARKRMRARIRHAAFTRAPVWLSRGKLAEVDPRQCPARTCRNLVLPELPDALDGLKIAHISDLHIGHLITPAHLPRIVEMTAAIQGDIVAITGDFVDFTHDVLDDVIAALQKLSAPLGVWMVPGNHDYLEDGPALVKRFRQAGLNLLLNETRMLDHEGNRIALGGIDWCQGVAEMESAVRTTATAMNGHGNTDLRILLAHHPHAFDEAVRCGVHVTLSGHTHGGQVMLSNRRGRKGSIGLGSLAFRYPQGLYQRGHHYLYVTSGVGSWFPLRVRCPAEVACLTLRSGPIAAEQASHP